MGVRSRLLAQLECKTGARAGAGDAGTRGPKCSVERAKGSLNQHSMTGSVGRLAALSDIHYSKSSQGSLLPLFTQIAEAIPNAELARYWVRPL